MSKILESPVKRWPGKITLPDSLTMPQYMAWVEAGDAANDAKTIAKKPGLYLPGILAVVKKWELGGGFPNPPTVDNFPGSPASASISLLLMLIGEIWAIVNEEDAPPNA